MPTGEVETHPYLQFGEAIPSAQRLILGSFPVYYCTDADTPEKAQKRAGKGIAQFFYGSHRSKFWKLYQTYVDPAIALPISREAAVASLSEREITISDTIVSAERKEHSASDKDLSNHEWNTAGLTRLFNNGIVKVLCTSKGVLRDLGKRIIYAEGNAIGEYSSMETLALQSQFISSIGGDVVIITEPIAAVYKLYNGSTVAALSIPSPGSAQRSIQHFGYVHGSKADYANQYFQQAFKWLLE